MNDPNCEAPCAPADGGHLTCEHGSTVRSPDAAEGCVDRITPQGEVAPGQCPLCDEPMELGSLDGEMMIYCPTCRGILLTNEVLGKVVARRRAEYQGADTTPAPIEPERLARGVACPQCQQPMECHIYGGPGAVVIDSCFDCRLVWLDSGEISSMERSAGVRRRPPKAADQLAVSRVAPVVGPATTGAVTMCDLAMEGLSSFLRCFDAAATHDASQPE